MGLIRRKDYQKVCGSPVGSKTKEGGNTVGLFSGLYAGSQLNLL